MLNALKCLLVWVSLSAAGCLTAATDARVAEAAKAQNIRAIRVLLAQHADVNAEQEDGATALEWAAHWDDLEAADLLVRAGARPDAANALGVTPLSLACVNGSAAMVQKLLSAGASANLSLPTGETPLMTCSRSGSVEAVKALLAHGASVNAKENLQDQTALMWAVAERHPEVVRVLLEHGADVQARSRITRQFVVREETGARLVCPPPPGITAPCVNAEEAPRGGSTPLLFAARSGDLDSAKMLVASGANVNDTAPDGNSALVVAAYSGSGRVAQFLLDKDAGPNAAGGGYTALHAAVLRGDLELVKALLAHAANPNARITKGTPITRSAQDFVLPDTLIGATPFFLAAKYVEPEVMRALAAAGADASVPTQDGTTALMAAAGIGWKVGETRRGAAFAMVPLPDDDRALEAVKIALAMGADVNAVNRASESALHGAATEGYTEIAQLLVDKGAALNALNRRGQTPLALTNAELLGAGGAYGVRDRKNTRALLLRLGAKEPAPSAGPVPKNLKILKDAAAIRPTMASFTVGLGVQCNFCHVQDRSSDENPHKDVARKMLLMVSEINAKFPGNNPRVTCFTCHRGESMPKTSSPAASPNQ
ncbi:MAG TPA: photosynthetic reaction center cytochrome c subunit family protein [Bryobacteraceae bacterium]|nr:photosynthetic reaction center cytochrome c subunit family protein [Bryobacteraceae bacterium]